MSIREFYSQVVTPGATAGKGLYCVIIRGKHKPMNRADFNGDWIVDMADFAAFAENWLQLSIVEY